MTHNIETLITCKSQGRDGKWYIAKPERAYGLYGLTSRIKDAWSVFKGESQAVYFNEDIEDLLSHISTGTITFNPPIKIQ